MSVSQTRRTANARKKPAKSAVPPELSPQAFPMLELPPELVQLIERDPYRALATRCDDLRLAVANAQDGMDATTGAEDFFYHYEGACAMLRACARKLNRVSMLRREALVAKFDGDRWEARQAAQKRAPGSGKAVARE